MRFDQALASYLPSTVVEELERPERGGRHGGGILPASALPIRQVRWGGGAVGGGAAWAGNDRLAFLQPLLRG